MTTCDSVQPGRPLTPGQIYAQRLLSVCGLPDGASAGTAAWASSKSGKSTTSAACGRRLFGSVPENLVPYSEAGFWPTNLGWECGESCKMQRPTRQNGHIFRPVFGCRIWKHGCLFSRKTSSVFCCLSRPVKSQALARPRHRLRRSGNWEISTQQKPGGVSGVRV